MSDFVISFGKYKTMTILDVWSKNPSYVKWLSILKPETIAANDAVHAAKGFLSKMCTDATKLKKKGSLTTRIRTLSSLFPAAMPCVPVPVRIVAIPVHPQHWRRDPISCGVFVDYLVRWIISRLRGEQFKDMRAGQVLCHALGMYTDETIADFLETRNVDLRRQMSTDKWYQYTTQYKLQNAYEVCQDCKLDSGDALQYVQRCAAFHQIFFDEDPRSLLEIDATDIESLKFYSMLIDYLRDCIRDSTIRILCNPGCGTETVAADCDLIIDKKLIEIKCSQFDDVPCAFVQCLGYVSFIEERCHIESVDIWNFTLGVRKIYDIEYFGTEDRKKYKALIEY
jgi:hypothetical protein